MYGWLVDMHNFPVSLSLSNLKTPMRAAVDGT